MLGYVEFLRRDWLVGIFGWQNESGCFMDSKKHLTIGRKLLEEERLTGKLHIYVNHKAAYRIFPRIRRPLDKTRYKIRANFYEFILYR